MNEQTLCVNCFSEIDTSIGQGEICPVCGFNNKTPELRGALKYGTLLEDRYKVGRVKCANSEGLTYAALDCTEDLLVDIREFYPATLVYRDDERVCPAENCEEAFESFYNEFLNMARGLTRLKDLSAVIPVMDMFWQNNTAYLVYEHMDSVSLKSYVQGRDGQLDWNAARDLFLPMVSSLSTMHALGIRHLGISPETLRVCKDGRMRLSEFSIESVRRVSRGLDPDLIPGCPAYEQYTRSMACGETTDVYAFAACLLYTVTGNLPAGANKRVDDQRLMIAREVLKTLPPHVVSAIASALQVRQEERTASFDRFKAEILAPPMVTSEVEETNAIRSLPRSHQNVPNDRNIPPKVWLFGSFLLTALVVVGVFYYLINYTDFTFSKITDIFEKQLEVSAATVVKVPNMVGDNYNDWLGELQDKNVYRFSITVSSQEFSDEIPEGQIISQSPEGGETVEEHGTVGLVVSRGPMMRKLPQINGEPFTKALELLQAEGFEVIKEESVSDSMVSGNVLWYGGDYRTGDELEYGTAVPVIVSTGRP